MVLASDLERYMLQLVNQERTSRGLNALVLEQNLNLSAEEHSQWMLLTSIFSHTGVNGTSATDRIRAADFDLEGAWRTAENLAVQSERGEEGLFDDVEDLHIALMNSPGHRANILNGDLVYVGIGIEIGDFTFDNNQGTFFSVMATQNFATTDAAVVLDTGEAGENVPNSSTITENQTIEGTNDADTLSGGAGDDFIQGLAGDDSIRGNDGNDHLRGGFGNDEVFGGDGDDVLYGNTIVEISSSETDSASGADNQWLAEFVTDLFDVSSFLNPTFTSNLVGVDVLESLDGDDILYGGNGDDLIYGDGGNDQLFGLADDDQLFGGNGNDRLEGGTGSDALSGGKGADEFVFSTNGGVDTISDFDSAQDRILLDDSIWSGDLSASQLVAFFGSSSEDSYLLDLGATQIELSGNFTDLTIANAIEIF